MTGRGGGLQNGRGGEQVKAYPYKKKGGGKFKPYSNGGGGTQSFKVDLPWEIEVLVILKGA